MWFRPESKLYQASVFISSLVAPFILWHSVYKLKLLILLFRKLWFNWRCVLNGYSKLLFANLYLGITCECNFFLRLIFRLGIVNFTLFSGLELTDVIGVPLSGRFENWEVISSRSFSNRFVQIWLCRVFRCWCLIFRFVALCLIHVRTFFSTVCFWSFSIQAMILNKNIWGRWYVSLFSCYFLSPLLLRLD